MNLLAKLGIGALAATTFYTSEVQAQDMSIGVHPPGEVSSFYESIPERSAVVLANSAITGLVSLLHGRSFWDGFKNSLPVHAAAEAVYTANSALIETPLRDNPVPYIAGQVQNSLAANIASGKPLCSDIGIRYALFYFNNNCGDLDVSIDFLVAPEMMANWFAGGELELDMTLKRGVIIYAFDEWESPYLPSFITGDTALAAAAGFRTVGYVRHDKTIGEVNEYLRLLGTSEASQMNHPDTLNKAIRYLQGRIKEIETKQTMSLNHEQLGHILQFDLISKYANSYEEVPWWVRTPITLPGTEVKFRLPTLEVILFGFNMFAPKDYLKIMEWDPRIENFLTRPEDTTTWVMVKNQ
jgi:hypothetical protein